MHKKLKIEEVANDVLELVEITQELSEEQEEMHNRIDEIESQLIIEEIEDKFEEPFWTLKKAIFIVAIGACIEIGAILIIALKML